MPSACFATADEQRLPLPGDALVPCPAGVVSHAITIRAAPARVWPWLLQMGGGRAGWYSWDWIDNGGRPSATALLPDHQRLAVGDRIPAMPGSATTFRVALLVPGRDLVLAMEGPGGDLRLGWAFHLEPLPDGGTRLLMRAATAGGQPEITAGGAGAGAGFARRYFALLARGPRPLFRLGARFGHYVMGAKMLNGIRRRAEGRLAGPR